MQKLGRIVLGLAIVGGAAGLASFALYEGLGMITTDTSVDMSLGAAAGAVLLEFALRRRAGHARDGMFVGLATLGAWFQLLVYALGQDTP
jgi:hypothetical protein